MGTNVFRTATLSGNPPIPCSPLFIESISSEGFPSVENETLISVLVTPVHKMEYTPGFMLGVDMG